MMTMTALASLHFSRKDTTIRVNCKTYLKVISIFFENSLFPNKIGSPIRLEKLKPENQLLLMYLPI